MKLSLLLVLVLFLLLLVVLVLHLSKRPMRKLCGKCLGYAKPNQETFFFVVLCETQGFFLKPYENGSQKAPGHQCPLESIGIPKAFYQDDQNC